MVGPWWPSSRPTLGGRRIVPDGTVRDEFRLPRGWWEAKDTSDNLSTEIQKKLRAGYPSRNTVFEDTRTAILYQDRAEAGEFALREPVKIADLLNRFLSHDESDELEFRRAMEEFKSRIPDLAQSLYDNIAEAHKKNPPQFLEKLDPYYRAIEREGSNLRHFTEKQDSTQGRLGPESPSRSWLHRPTRRPSCPGEH